MISKTLVAMDYARKLLAMICKEQPYRKRLQWVTCCKPLKYVLQHMHVRSILTRWHEVEKQQQTRVSLPLQQKEQVEIIFPRQGQEKN